MDPISALQEDCKTLISSFLPKNTAASILEDLLQSNLMVDELRNFELEEKLTNPEQNLDKDTTAQHTSNSILEQIKNCKNQEFLLSFKSSLEAKLHSNIQTIEVVRVKKQPNAPIYRLVLLAKLFDEQHVLMALQISSSPHFDETAFVALFEEEKLTNPKRIYFYMKHFSKEEWISRVVSKAHPSQLSKLPVKVFGDGDILRDQKGENQDETSSTLPCIISIELLDEMSLAEFMDKILPRRRLICQARLIEQVHIAQSITCDFLQLLEDGKYFENLTADQFNVYCYKERYNPPVLAFVLPKSSGSNDSTNNGHPKLDVMEERRSHQLEKCIQDLGGLYIHLFSAEETQETNLIQIKEDILQESHCLLKLSPILQYSLTLRRLVGNMLNNPKVALRQIKEVDWDELFDDFQHNYRYVFDTRLVKLNPWTGLCVPSVATKVFKDDQVRTGLIEVLEKENFQVMEETSNEEKLPKVEEWINFLLERRPADISDIISKENTCHFPASFLSLLQEKTEAAWEQEFLLHNLEYLGQARNSLVFQTRTDQRHGSVLKLLFPHPTKATCRFGVIRQDSDFEQENHFYDHITVTVLHHEEIVRFAQEGPILPGKYQIGGEKEIRELILNAGKQGYRAEIWKIQQRRDGRSLKSWMNCDLNGSSKMEVIHGIFEAAQRFFKRYNGHRSLSLENIYFSQNRADGFLLNIREYSILNQREVNDYYKDSRILRKEIFQPNIRSNIYTIGKIIKEIINWRRDTRINPYGNFYNVPHLVEMMLETNPELDEMTVEQFQTIWWNEETKQFEFRANNDLSRQEISLLFRFGDFTVAERVIPVVMEETVKLFKEVFNGAKFMEAVLASSQGRDDKEYYEGLLPPEQLNDLETLLNYLIQNRVPVYHTLYRFLFRLHQSPEITKFKQRLYHCIEMESVAGLQPVEPVGQGAFGYVFKQKEPGYKLNTAVKLIIPRTKKDEEYTRGEIGNLSDLRHPNIVFFIEWIQRKFTEEELRGIFKYGEPIPEGNPTSAFSSCQSDEEIPLKKLLMRARNESFVTGYFIEMEYCDFTLKNWMDSNSSATPLIRDQLKIIRGLIRGMKYLQLHKIMHYDLKPDNILIKRKPGEEDKFSVKIADFGLSKFMGNIDDTKAVSGDRGNLKYKAPEVLRKAEGAERGDPLQSEIFSVGLLALEILTTSITRLPIRVRATRFSNSLPDKLASVKSDSVDCALFATAIRKMLEEDCQRRMSCEEFSNLDFDWNSLAASKDCEVLRDLFKIRENA